MKNVFFSRPPKPQQLLAELVAIFPQFHDDDIIEDIEESDHALHTIMRHFCAYFGIASKTCSEKQLQRLAALIHESVKVQDSLENAVSTCFLEHLSQIGAYKKLAPFLSKK